MISILAGEWTKDMVAASSSFLLLLLDVKNVREFNSSSRATRV